LDVDGGKMHGDDSGVLVSAYDYKLRVKEGKETDR